MTKVKISKEWSNVIEFMKNNDMGFEYSLNRFLNKSIHIIKDKKLYDSITLEDFSLAYLVGYEVYETAEEALAFIYNSYKSSCELWHEGYCSGILETLYILGIKVDGIND